MGNSSIEKMKYIVQESLYMEYLIFISIFFLSCYATYKVCSSYGFEKRQTIILSLLIWFIPIIASLIILLFINDDETPRKPKNRENGAGKDSKSIAAGGD